MQLLFTPLLFAASVLLGAAVSAAPGDMREHRAAINAVLDDFHRAAAEADRDRYLDHFAPNGVFMGTDDWERWPLEEFSVYVQQRFANGTGWTYRPRQRVIDFAVNGTTAWFDELALSERWGRFRGTGVLILLDGEWKIAHYSLTMLVPNERFEDAARVAGEGFAARDTAREK